ncbi:MAGL2 protein, partial [Pseudoatta argentina]
MADQQLRGNKIRVFNVRVRQYLRKHYKSKEECIAICIHCLSEIRYRNQFSLLFLHLTVRHTELLTEEQKTDYNIHWAWDYFTPTSSGDAQCNICNKILKSIADQNLTRHLNLHRKTSATKTLEPSEYSANSSLESIEKIMANVKLPPELKPLDTEEVAGREELPGRVELPVGEELSVGHELPVGEELPVEEERLFGEELPVGEEFPFGEELPVGEIPIREALRNMDELQVLLNQSSDETRNFYSPDRECEITFDLLKKE